ncbi:hypothetical protein B0H10DRAFT_2311252 [Mycena sp. CBHHK59/15]|nr:hypothetical protein B0H10DRAFT_2311252 [Mycena sp. CBHHK59/15]
MLSPSIGAFLVKLSPKFDQHSHHTATSARPAPRFGTVVSSEPKTKDLTVGKHLDEEESDDEAGERISTRLVNSGAAWRKVYTSWVVAARVEEMAAEDTEGSQTVVEPPAPQRPGWLPCPLSRLFAGKIPQPPGVRAPRKTFTQQQLLMELLTAEHSEEEPDDGELEGSGDDYDSDD